MKLTLEEALKHADERSAGESGFVSDMALGKLAEEVRRLEAELRRQIEATRLVTRRCDEISALLEMRP